MTTSTHDEDFNALARLKPVKKAVCRFPKELPEEKTNCHRTLPGLNQVWNAINTTCLRGEMLWAGWWCRPEEKGFTTSGCESAWLADPVGACVPDNTKSQLRKKQMLRPMQRRWNGSIQQQTFLRWHTQVENQIPKFSRQTSRRKLHVIHLKHVAREVKSRVANNTEWPQDVNWNRELLSTDRHWTGLGNQQKHTISSPSQTKLTDGRFCPWFDWSHDDDLRLSDTNWPDRQFLSQVEINTTLFCEVAH